MIKCLGLSVNRLKGVDISSYFVDGEHIRHIISTYTELVLFRHIRLVIKHLVSRHKALNCYCLRVKPKRDILLPE